MSSPVVTIRMYRELLGDCFLVRIGDGSNQSSILIDCGVLQGTSDARDRMVMVAEDIRHACGGRLDLVVATHRHADHLSGFAHAAEIFFERRDIRIDNLWLAWTEQPDDPQAKELRARFDKRRETVRTLAARIAAAAPGSPFAAAPPEALDGLQAFLGERGSFRHRIPDAAARPRSTDETIDALRSVAGTTRYLNPGDVLPTPGTASLRAFVLAPPRDEKLLFKDLPSSGSAKETYLASRGFNESLLDAVAADPDADRSGYSPFAARDRTLLAKDLERFVPPAPAPDGALPWDATIRAWLKQRYFDDRPPCRFTGNPLPDHDCERDIVCGDDQSRRRIDGNWMASAGQLALKLDSDTNNTSLVLAFELPDRTFLLFAADAQVGNWESWHRQSYVAGAEVLTAWDILQRTRFYKVGHHGSHNATLNELGLALMTRPDLVAAVSTVETFARKQGRKGWLMPNPRVKGALLESTQGRLIRGDRKWHEDEDVRAYPPIADFIDRLDESSPLYVDYRVFG